MSSNPGSNGGPTPEQPEDKPVPPKAETERSRGDGAPEEQEAQKRERWRKLSKAALSWALRTAVTWWLSNL
nr:hypothetical protein GCM10017745_35460 [Saccharothrix mutabilis subsp. capreolus]